MEAPASSRLRRHRLNWDRGRQPSEVRCQLTNGSRSHFPSAALDEKWGYATASRYWSISISRHLTLDYLEQRFPTLRDSTGAGLWMISEIPEMDRPNFLPTAVFGH